MASTSSELAVPPGWPAERAPRIWHVPDYEVSSTAAEAVDLCRSYGLALDPWQEFVLVNSLGERFDGKWAAFEVGINVARQNGKNEIAVARELVGLFLLDEGLLIHSAHEFKTSTEHQRRLEEIIQDTPELHKRVKPRGYRHSHGEEGIELRTGKRIRFMTRTKGGGRGHTGDLVVLDESMILPAAMVGALMPTLSARSIEGNPQLWYLFTAVDKLIHEHGQAVARIRARGMAGDPSLAYFEWSADAENPDEMPTGMATDPAAWLQANPALGIRISDEHVAKEQRSMDPRTFAVERLGVGDYPSSDGEDGTIDFEVWKHLSDTGSIMSVPCIAFDVTPDRAFASIAEAGFGRDGLPHVQLIEHQRGTKGIVSTLAELNAKRKPLAIVCDSVGAAASLLPELADLNIEIVPLTTAEHAAGCGWLFDAVDQRRLRHHGQQELDAAVKSAKKRPVGSRWLWDRESGGVISPLVACTLALWAVMREPPKPVPRLVDLAALD